MLKNADGDGYYHLGAVAQGDDAFWFTEFICPEAATSTYETRFLNWAVSIVVSGRFDAP